MKKQEKQIFLYRYRFIIGYIFLMVAFFGLLTFLPTVAPGGLSQDEMNSVVEASKLNASFISDGNVINLPYLLLQKISISLFGITLFSIKLPSIIIAVFAAFFIILLLNRWFKSDVAVVGSILTTLSTAFLFLAGFGTPVIMYIFWLALILWLGSKIVGNNHVHPLLVVSFAIAVSLSVYTPHLFYVALVIAIAGIMHPHLRFALKQLKPYQTVFCFAIAALIVAPLAISCIFHLDLIPKLIWTNSFGIEQFATNISSAFAPFFSFSMAYDSIYLAPLFGLANITLIVIGALASMSKLYTSRNAVVSLLIIFSILVSGLNPSIAISIIIPVAVLSAAGLESIIDKWHSLFPENPYAHFLGTTPIVIVVLMIIFSGLAHFIYGYHYTPRVTKNFTNDITLINENLPIGSILVIDEGNPSFGFYKLLETYNDITVVSDIPERAQTQITLLGKTAEDKSLELKRIITSPKTRNSDRLYIYEKVSQQ